MSLARKMARKAQKAMRVGNERGAKQAAMVKEDVKTAYVRQRLTEVETRNQALENLSSVFMIAMHERYKFGAGKLIRLRDKIRSEFESIRSGNVTVDEINDFLRDNMSFLIGGEIEKGANRKRQIEFKATSEMSAAFLMALVDEFGFRKKRLGDAYSHCIDVCERLERREITYPIIREQLKVVFARHKVENQGHYQAISKTRKAS